MKAAHSWWTSFGGTVPIPKIRAIQNDARPNWLTPDTHGAPRDSAELLLLTDRNEIIRGSIVKGKPQILGILRKPDDQQVNFTAYMYVADLQKQAIFPRSITVVEDELKKAGINVDG